jgi:hypothetical protein
MGIQAEVANVNFFQRLDGQSIGAFRFKIGKVVVSPLGRKLGVSDEPIDEAPQCLR